MSRNSALALHNLSDRMFGGASSPVGEGSSDASSPPGFQSFIASLRSRGRALTEEAVVGNHYNISQSLTTSAKMDESPIAVESMEADTDTKSSCSSLSDDSRRCILSKAARQEADDDEKAQQATNPPQAIFIPALPKFGSASSRSYVPPAPVWTGCSSPFVDRPPAPRQKRILCRDSFPMIPRSPAVSKGGTLCDTGSNSQGMCSTKAPGLLGDRPKRMVRRAISATTTISVGSIVGQSSLVTTPTASSAQSWMSPSIETRSLCSQEPTRRKVLHRRLRGVVKDEIKYMLGRVATPIRRLAKPEEKADLKRADGCLT